MSSFRFGNIIYSMPYERRPFNPLTPIPNQVITELNQANENFDIIAQAFLSDNPETFIVKNADKVDGFHASTTPTPFTIPVAGADGKIPLGWLPDSVLGGGGGGGYRRINMTNATSDYDLQIGEEAYYEWESYPNTALPLRIIVSGSLYQIIISSRRTNLTGGSTLILIPNNTIYTSFDDIVIHSVYQYGTYGGVNNLSPLFHFFHLKFGNVIGFTSYINAIFNTKRKGGFCIALEYNTFHEPFFKLISYFWRGNIPWTSLGTLFYWCDHCSEDSYSYPPDYLSIIVRRLV